MDKVRSRFRTAGAALLLALAGCGSIPADPERTLERVLSTGQMRIGVIAGEAGPAGAARRAALVRALAGATGAQPLQRRDAADALFVALEAGALDLVIGPIDAQSPWRRRVTVLPPLIRLRRGTIVTDVTAVARNGENRWIDLVYRQSRRVAAAG